MHSNVLTQCKDTASKEEKEALRHPDSTETVKDRRLSHCSEGLVWMREEQSSVTLTSVTSLTSGR